MASRGPRTRSYSRSISATPISMIWPRSWRPSRTNPYLIDTWRTLLTDDAARLHRPLDERGCACRSRAAASREADGCSRGAGEAVVADRGAVVGVSRFRVLLGGGGWVGGAAGLWAPVFPGVHG